MYSVFVTGGKQYKVQPGDEIYVEKLDAAEGETVTFDKVVALYDDKTLHVGTPYVKNASVTATAVKNGKAKKITVFTYKSKKNEKRKMGHRQPYTKLQIESASIAKPARAKKAAAVEEAPAETTAE